MPLEVLMAASNVLVTGERKMQARGEGEEEIGPHMPPCLVLVPALSGMAGSWVSAVYVNGDSSPKVVVDGKWNRRQQKAWPNSPSPLPQTSLLTSL